MSDVKYCKNCAETRENVAPFSKDDIKNIEFTRGFIIGFPERITSCPWCKSDITDVPITSDDFFCLRDTSNYNRELLEAMIQLKEKDIIEYELKMSQFRNQSKQAEQIQSQPKPTEKQLTCPQCGSTDITSGTRGFTLTTGFLGSGNHRNVCKKCGFKWKPGGWLEALNRDLHGHK